MPATDASRIMRDQGVNPPPIGFGKEIILGSEFDSDKPNDYLKSIGKT
jgi:nitrate/nitrite transport system substrate-binding protein